VPWSLDFTGTAAAANAAASALVPSSPAEQTVVTAQAAIVASLVTMAQANFPSANGIHVIMYGEALGKDLHTRTVVEAVNTIPGATASIPS
jgi:hypothetical protein